MTRTFFDGWLKSWDKQLQTKQRKVALLMNNCSAHKPTIYLKNVSIFLLPPNTTSILQPCEMGVIKSMKSYFRHEMRQKHIDILNDALEAGLTA